MNDTLLILGASARAAAQSARRAGFFPHAADLFGDEDLCACCPTTRVDDYPWGLLQASRNAPPGEWLYTGALENYPELVTQIAAERPLLGNPPEVSRRVRDPLRIAASLHAAGLRSPRVAITLSDVPRDGSWLRKRIRSAGGTHISAWDAACELKTRGNTHEIYYQERIDGVPCSAVFVAAGGHAVLLGVTRQLVGRSFGAPSEFQYVGSIGPEPYTPEVLAQWRDIGCALSEAFSLRGLFGVDAILAEGDGPQEIWPVEVNPRYTASIEILERAHSRGPFNAIQAHVAACREGRLLPAEIVPQPAVIGKQVVFAERDLRVPDRFARCAADLNAHAEWPLVADIPAVGSALAMNSPVVTVFAQGDSPLGVQESLGRLANRIRAELAPS